MEVLKKVNTEALLEMAGMEGWRIIEEMLVYDVKFATSLLTRPKPPKRTGTDAAGNPITADQEWLVSEHEIGRARGILATATKYLDKIRNAKERYNKKGE
jgi:hypothetical protein